MSTVAYKDGVFAADTQMTWGDEPDFEFPKIYKIGDWLVGMAGAASIQRPYYDWIKIAQEQSDDPSEWYRYEENLKIHPEHGGTVAIANRDGELWTLQSGWAVRSGHDYIAFGNGGDYAMGAMQFGATAAEGIAVARLYDVYTGGKIITVDFDCPDTDFRSGLTGQTEKGIAQYKVVG